VPGTVPGTGPLEPGWRLRQGGRAAAQHDQPVSLQRAERVAVRRLPAGGDRAQRLGAALSERALERRLLALRLVARAAGRARCRQRARAAARDARQAHGRAEVEERLRARPVELLAGAFLDAAHVG